MARGGFIGYASLSMLLLVVFATTNAWVFKIDVRFDDQLIGTMTERSGVFEEPRFNISTVVRDGACNLRAIATSLILPHYQPVFDLPIGVPVCNLYVPKARTLSRGPHYGKLCLKLLVCD